jgi:hypothetical protein
MELTPHVVEGLRLKSAPDLKDSLPMYPVVRREEAGKEIAFSSLVRKKYDGKYYLIPFRVTEKTEAKAIHALHAYVYKYLMLGEQSMMDVVDDDQTNEVTRLKK